MGGINRSPLRTELYFDKYPFLNFFRGVISASVVVDEAEIPKDFINLKVPASPGIINRKDEECTCNYPDNCWTMTGYVILFDEKGRAMYSLGRTSRGLRSVGFKIEKNRWFASFCGLTIFFSLLSLLSIIVPWHWLTYTFLCCIVASLICMLLNIDWGMWSDDYNESIAEAFHSLDRVGEQSQYVRYVVVYDPTPEDGDRPSLTLYQLPHKHPVRDLIRMSRPKKDRV